MSDHYEALRKALHQPLLTCHNWHAPGLGELHDTKGCAHPDGSRVIGMFIDVDPVPDEERPVPAMPEADTLARFVAAANPDTIRELLRERDALQDQTLALEQRVDALMEVDKQRAQAAEAVAAERDALLGLLGEAREYVRPQSAFYDDADALLSRIDAAISQEKEEGK